MTRTEARRIVLMFEGEVFRLLALQEAPPVPGPHFANHEGLYYQAEGAEDPRAADGPPRMPEPNDDGAPPPKANGPPPKAKAAEPKAAVPKYFAGGPPPPPPKAAAHPAPQYDPCRFCGEVQPDHPGSRCPARQPGKAGPAPADYRPGGYRSGNGGTGPRFYAVWWPRRHCSPPQLEPAGAGVGAVDAAQEAGGPWHGHWGAMRAIHPDVCGKRCDSEESARSFLLDHGDTVYASRVLSTTGA